MKELISEKRFDIISLIIVAFFPFYKNALSSISIIVFSAVTLGCFIYSKQKIQKLDVRNLFIVTGYFLYSILSLSYSSDIKEGFSELKTSVPILLFPLILFLFGGNISRKHLKYITFSFVISCSLQAIYILSQFYSHGLFNKIGNTQFYNLPFRELIYKLDYMKFHPSYLSLWLLFAVMISVHYLFENYRDTKLYQKLLLFISIALLLFVSIASSAKISIIAFGFAMLYFLFSKIKGWKMKLVGVLAFLTISVVAIFKIPFLKVRFVDEIKVTKFEPPVGNTHNSINIRFGIMKCFSDVFSENWLFGVGIGDAPWNTFELIFSL